MTHHITDLPEWEVDVDGASNVKNGGAGLILPKGEDMVIKASVKIDCPISNNKADYEVLVTGLALACEVRAKKITRFSNSEIATSQANGEYQARDLLFWLYLKKAKNEVQHFDSFHIKHIPREQNTQTDVLSKLANTTPGSGSQSLI
ncbi:uncharacterized protein [Arachis hypogaea]|uniref:uncharacterized protein n=1 Tax=Arachis hypogaea TaxID=3818 RepID=UPI003B21CF47